MQTEAPSVRRVVIGFDPAPADAAALQVAAGLAARRGAPLVGLYVEDERLLRLAELPFARELGFPSAHSRRMRPQDIAAALRAQAEHVRRLVARTADPLKLIWTLEVVRGELLRAALGATAMSDLLVVPGAQAIGLPRPVRAGGPVVVVFEETSAARRALVLAGELRRATGSELVVLVEERDVAAFRALRAATPRDPDSGAAGARWLQLPRDDLGLLKRILLVQRPAAVVLPRRGDEDLERLARPQFACPLILVG